MKNEKKSKGIDINILIGVLLGAVIIVAVIAFLKWSDNNEASTVDTSTENVANTGTVEKWQEGDISYNGTLYRYNTDIKTYLFLGIDKSGVVEESENSHKGGQSDAMFLMVVNPDIEEISVIAINRNTMTEVDVYDQNDNYIGPQELQICLQHAYGDGMRSSCLRTTQTVSKLFYDIPITEYLSLNMDGIPILNDAVGGVTVEVLEDIDAFGVTLKEGEVVNLTGEQAYAYTRSRDTSEFDSATRRLERQNQYILSLMSKVKGVAAQGEAALTSIYESAEDYIVTNIDFLKLAEDVAAYGFDASNVYSIPGETIMGARYEEHYIDENALYDMVIEIFYEPVEQEN